MFNFYENHQYSIDVVHHTRALKYSSHIHDEFEFIYLFNGEQGIIIDDKSYTLHSGDCAVIFPQIPHSYIRPDNIPKNNSNADSAIIFLPALTVHQMFPSTVDNHPRDCVIYKENMHPDISLSCSKIIDEENINAQIGWSFIIFSHALPLICTDTIKDEENTRNTSKVLSYITKNFRKSLTLDMLSDELGINKYYISRIFSKTIKISFRSYLGKLRCNYAASLIKTSNRDFNSIAEESGFESIRSFYRVFKEIYGMTPAEYRDYVRGSK